MFLPLVSGKANYGLNFKLLGHYKNAETYIERRYRIGDTLNLVELIRLTQDAQM